MNDSPIFLTQHQAQLVAESSRYIAYEIQDIKYRFCDRYNVYKRATEWGGNRVVRLQRDTLLWSSHALSRVSSVAR